MLPFFKALESRMDKIRSTSGVRTEVWPIFAIGLLILFISYLFMPAIVSLSLSLSLFLAPLWLPVLLVGAGWALWLILKRSEFIADQRYILLEIKPPRTIAKTPLAMEAVLSGLHHSPGEGNWYRKFILGGVRPYWSLEIVSLEGNVHFFIWTRAGFRRIIEAQLYAQYPGVQVTEALDYTRMISAKHEEWGIWGCDFKHTQADPLPIRTYVEYGLDKVQKEPEQVDPLANLVEVLGSMRKGEYLWLQLIIRVHKGEKYGKRNQEGKAYTWKDAALEEIERIREKAVYKSKTVDVFSGKQIEMPILNPTKGQADKMAAIERNISKLAFDVGARGIYLASKGNFDPITISALTGVFKYFGSEGWNGFRPTGWMTYFDDYPWELGANKKKNVYRAALIEAYRRRQYYYEPFNFTKEAMVMSTEELATLFHVPSRAVEAPSLPRVPSATSEAPSNLPT